MINPDSHLSFTELCTLLEQIASANNVDDKRKCFVKLVEVYNLKTEQLKHANPNVSRTFYPVLRLLLPHEERDRGPYNLKEFTFIKTIINILGLSPTGRDAKFLKNYKSSDNLSIKHFSDAAHFILKQRFNNPGILTVYQVNESLDEIAAKANDIRAQEKSVLKLFQNTSQFEQKWVIRMLLKELRLGIGRDNILKAFHPDAVDLYNNVHSLTKICDTLQDPNIRLDLKVTVTLFDHFQPMLSTRCTGDELRKAFKVDRPYVVEKKFDGERFQLHCKNGVFKYFSRQGFEYSANYGESYDSIGYTSKLRNVFKDDMRSVILDGEMMIWNKLQRKFGCKGMTVDVKKLKLDHPKFTPCFCVFDILLLNDEVVMHKPLKERLPLIQDLITPVEGVINISQHHKAAKMNDVIKALNDAMDKEEEGIVFKDPDSVYAPASRKGWWKMKLEYFENVMSDLDVIIIGGYYGEGAARKNVKGFLVGVVDKSRGNPKYLSFAKIQSGLSYDEYKILSQKVNGHWLKVHGNDHEKLNIFWGKEVPDVWIKPVHSCCLLVRGTELIKINTAYKTPYTLRFPRILKIRLDKPYNDCLTLNELNDLTKSSTIVQKLNKRHLELSDIEVPKKKVKKLNYTFAPVDNVSDALEGREFLVLSGKGSWSKENVETAIRENSGVIVRAESRKTCCMLAGDDHIRISTYKGEIDIVSVDWLRRVLNEGEFMMYTPRDMVYTSPKTRKKFARLYDKFGDMFAEPATVGSIMKIVNEMNDKGDHQILSNAEIKELFAEMQFQDDKVFRNFNVYFDKVQVIDDVTSDVIEHEFFDEIDFMHRGGTVCDTVSQDCDFIITKGNNERIMYLKSHLGSNNRESVKIVNFPNDLLNE